MLMQKASKRLPQWLRDTLMFILIMGCAVAVCELLSVCYDDNNPFATSVFILAVVLVSRFTTGYWPGILASAVGVVSVGEGDVLVRDIREGPHHAGLHVQHGNLLCAGTHQ